MVSSSELIILGQVWQGGRVPNFYLFLQMHWGHTNTQAASQYDIGECLLCVIAGSKVGEG